MTRYEEFEKAVAFFVEANEQFVGANKHLFDVKVSERCFCGALMNQMNLLLNFTKSCYRNYYVDVEYNRDGEDFKRNIENKKISCDIILHSRGNFPNDNIIAIEMKKESNSNDPESDKARLMDMTKPTCSDREVCGYALGIFYTIAETYDKIDLEYYKDGKKVDGLIEQIDLNEIWKKQEHK